MSEDAKPEAQASLPASDGSVIFVRFGDIPEHGKSKNHLTGKLEAGVSCYEAIRRGDRIQVILPKLETTGLVSLSGVNERPMHEVRGAVVGYGSDGEPLLRPCHIVVTLSPI